MNTLPRRMDSEIAPAQQLDANEVATLKSSLRGRLLSAGDDGYDATRRIWNGMFNRYPLLIARCQGVADVVDAVNFARRNKLLVAVRGGGHNVAGNAVCDGGLMIDLSLMRSIWVDPVARTAHVQGGATWGDLDRDTQVFGLATPGGLVSTTGVAGLTLAGGYGYLRKKYGLSCDNLLSVQMVTADGKVVKASETENADLFWGIRGGGGNFGVVTSFEFRLHPVGPNVLNLLVLYPAEKSKEILRKCYEYLATAPDELSIITLITAVPSGPPFPEHLHGQQVLRISGIYCGPVEQGEAVLEPLRHLETPVLDWTAPRPYAVVQSMSDARYPIGDLYYFKACYLHTLDDQVLEEIMEWTFRRPSPRTLVNLWHMGGAIDRVTPAESAFSNRNVPYLLEIASMWSNPAQSEENIAWSRGLASAMERYSTGASYLNFPGFGEEGDSLVKSSYGANYQRLVALKNRYDPGNLFRMNQNIKPTIFRELPSVGADANS